MNHTLKLCVNLLLWGCLVLGSKSALAVDFLAVCDRTTQVRDLILEEVGESECANVTEEEVAEIDGTFSLNTKGIVSLKAGDFSSLTSIEALFLYDNELTALPNGVFDDLTSLNYLRIYRNNLSSLPSGVFDSLTNLRSLDLDNNELTSLPAGIFDNLKTLDSLSLRENQLNSLSGGIFDELIVLDELYLSSNQLTSLSQDIFDNLTALTSLTLGDNELTSLPAGVFDKLTALTILGLRQNQIVSLPDGIFDNLIALDTLTLYSNQLSSLPEGVFDDLTNLQTLWLSENHLNTLPDGIFNNLTSLVRLYLQGNDITSLSEGVFDDLAYLLYLYLDGNLVSTLPEGVFDDLSSLLHLDLGSNDFTTLPEGVFAGLTTLTNLYLQRNDLTSLSEGVFGDLTALTTLYLYENELTKLPKGVFAGLTALSSFSIRDNSADLPIDINLSLSSDTISVSGELNFTFLVVQAAPEDLEYTLSSDNGVFKKDNQVITSVSIAQGTSLSDNLTFVLDQDLTSASISISANGSSDINGLIFPTKTQLVVLYDFEEQTESKLLLAGLPLNITLPSALGGVGETTYSLTGLGAELIFDPETLVLSGTPTVIDTLNLSYVATDSANNTLTSNFTIETYDSILPVCNRTSQVRDELVNVVSGKTNCANVTKEDLEALNGTLDLSDSGIISLKEGDFSGLSALDRLDIYDNDLTQLPESIFDGLASLTWLGLQQNEITSIPNGIFSDLVSLDRLLLFQNNLTQIPAGLFDGLTELTALSIRDNNLIALPEGILADNKKINKLWLYNNNLSALPAGLFEGLSLSFGFFEIYGNANDLPLELIANFSSPKLSSEGELNFTFTVIQGAPKTITYDLSSDNGSFQLNGATVTSVDITTGSLTSDSLTFVLNDGEISANIDITTTDTINDFALLNLTAFVEVYGFSESVANQGFLKGDAVNITLPIALGGTGDITYTLTGLGTELVFDADTRILLGNLTTLDALNLSYVAIDKDNSSITSNFTIQTFEDFLPVCYRTPIIRDGLLLTLSESDCASITKANLEDLESLIFIDKELVSLKPGDFSGLSAIFSLYVGLSSLTQIPVGLFNDLSSLEFLYLDNNHITELAAGAFKGLGTLRHLQLNDNNLTSLPDNIFDDLPSLVELRLQSNQLTSLTNEVFDGLTFLNKLYLNDNQLTSMPAGVFDGLTSLNKLYLNDNQLTSLPAEIFNGLVALNDLSLSDNTNDLPLDLVANFSSHKLSNEGELNFTFTVVQGSPEIITYDLISDNGSFQLNGETVTSVNITTGTLTSGNLTFILNDGEISANINIRTDDTIDGFSLLNLTAFLEVYDFSESVANQGFLKGDTFNLTLPEVTGGSGEEIYSVTGLGSELMFDADSRLLSGTLATAGMLSMTYQVVDLGNDILEMNFTVVTYEDYLPVCFRTQQVQAEILDRVGKVNCSDVSQDDVEGINNDFDLSNASITHLKAGDLSGISVYDLFLNNNNLTSLNAGIFTDLSVYELHLNHNQIESIEAEIFDGMTMSRLYLNNNKLTNMKAGWFNGLKVSVGVYLENNDITNLEQGIFNDFSVFGLYLNGNQLTNIESGWFDGLTVTRLDLDDNNLVSLDEGWFDGLKVSNLYLSYNNLTSLESLWLNGLKLSSLYLNHNNLTTLDPLWFEGLSVLRLRLNNNQLTSLPGDLFNDLPNLVSLNLQYNEINQLPVGVFDGLSALEELYLYDNQLTSLPAGIFDGLTALEDLYLYDNQLTSLPAGVFNGLTALDDLYIYDNDASLPIELSINLTSANIPSSKELGFSFSVDQGAPQGLTYNLNSDNGSFLLNGVTVESVSIAVGNSTSGNLTFVLEEGKVSADINITTGMLHDGLSFSNLTQSVELFRLEEQTANQSSLTGIALNITLPLALGNSGEVTYTLTGLGTELSFDADSRELFGTPTQANVLNLSYQATDLNNDMLVSNFSIHLSSFLSVCDRTQTIKDGLLEALFESDCSAITLEDLESLNGTLDFSDSGLTSLKVGDFSGLTYLDILPLHNNELTQLPESIFNGLSTLTRLYLQGNDLTSLSASIFSGLVNLERVPLTGNSLKELPEGLFDGLTEMNYVSLRENGLNSLPKGLFADNHKIEGLYMNGNNLSLLPAGFFEGLTVMTSGWFYDNANDIPIDLSIDLASSKIPQSRAINFNFTVVQGAPETLTYHLSSSNGTFELDGDSIESIDISLGTSVSDNLTFRLNDGEVSANIKITTSEIQDGLVFLNLTHWVQLHSLEESIENQGLLSGDTLNISLPAIEGNNNNTTYTLTGLGSELSFDTDTRVLSGSPTVIETLNLSYVAADLNNNTLVLSNFTIQTFDSFLPVCYRTQIIQAKLLKQLSKTNCADVTEADLKTITETLVFTDSIVSLKAGDFSGLTDLSDLSLDYNNLTSLPAGIFDGLTSLTMLFLDENQFTTLPAGIFDGLTSLNRLYLHENNLTTLPAGVFDSLAALTYLNINSNQLVLLPENVFNGLTSLDELHLNNNQLTSLPSGVFNSLASLDYLLLNGNPIDLPIELSLNLSSDTIPDSGALNFTFSVVQAAPLNLTYNLTSDSGIFERNGEIVTSVDMTVGSILSDNLTFVLNEGQSSGFINITTKQTLAGAIFENATAFVASYRFNATIEDQQILSGTAFNITLPSMLGGSGEVSYSVTGLGSGLSFDTTTRELFGKLTTAGVLNLTYQAIDANNNVLQLNFTVSIFADYVSICERTDQIQSYILDLLSKTNCTLVTEYDLAGISIFDLTTSKYTELSLAGLSTLTSNDFAGMNTMTTLNLSAGDGYFPALPAGIFNGLSNLEDVQFSAVPEPDLAINLDWNASSAYVDASGNLDFSFSVVQSAPGNLTYLLASDKGSFLWNGASISSVDIPSGTSVSDTLTFVLNENETSALINITQDGTTVQGLSFATIHQNVELDSQPVFDAMIADQTLLTGDLLNLSISSVSGGNGEINYTVTGLGEDFVYNLSSSTLSGIAQTAGIYSVSYQVTDIDGDSVQQNFSISVELDSEPGFNSVIANQTLLTGDVLNLSIPSVSSGNGVLNYSISGAGDDFVYDQNLSTLSGQVTTVGIFNVTYQVTDTDGDSIQQNFTINVQLDTQPVFNSTVANQILLTGDVLNLSLPLVIGGNSDLAYILNGAGTDFVFDQITGTLSGSASTVGDFNVSYQVTDFDGDSVQQNFTIIVQLDTQPVFASMIANQTVVLNHLLDLALPLATSGNGALDYSLTGASDNFAFDQNLSSLSGNATSIGVFNVSYQVTDSDGDSSQQIFSISVEVDSQPIFEDSVDNQTLNQADFISLSLPLAAQGNGELIYQLIGLGGDFSFNQSSQELSGIAIEVGILNLSYFVTDINGDIASLNFSVEVLPIPTPSFIESYANQSIVHGQEINLNLPLAVGGTGELSYSIVGLDGGFVFDANNLTITGIANNVDTYKLSYQVIDASNQTEQLNFSIQVLADVLPVLGQQADVSVVAGEALAVTLKSGTGGNGQLSYSLFGLSDGFAFNASSLQLTGQSQISGILNLTYQVSDSDGDIVNHSFSLLVLEDFTPAFDTLIANQIIINDVSFNLTLPVAAGGNGQLTYSLLGLSEDFQFNSSSLVLTGQSSTIGTLNLTYQVSDNDLDVSSLNFDLVVEVEASPLFSGSIDKVVADLDVMLNLTIPVDTSSGNGELSLAAQVVFNGTLSNKLPEGLSIDNNHFTISGYPIQAGVYQVTLILSDSDNLENDITDLSFYILVAEALAFNHTVDAFYGFDVNKTIQPITLSSAVGGRGEYTENLTVISGSLPEGIIYNPKTRTFTGSAQSTGSVLYNYTISDEDARTISTQINVSVLQPIPNIQVPADFIRMVGDQLSISLNTPVDEAQFEYSYSLELTNLENELPAGLTFDVNTTSLILDDVQPGNYSLTYTVQRKGGQSSSFEFVLSIEEDTIPVFASTSMSYILEHPSTVDISFVNATGLNGPLSYSWTQNNALAFAQLAYNATGNSLQGSTASLGLFNTTLSVSDADNDTSNISLIFDTQAASIPSFTATDKKVVADISQDLLSFYLPIDNSTGNGELLVDIQGLPAGFSYNQSNQRIWGVPTESGIFNISVTLSDSDNVIDISDTSVLSIKLTIAEALAFDGALPQAVYAYSVGELIDPINLPAATGGRGELSYSLKSISGELPYGLSYNSSSRTISGTPTESMLAELNYSISDEDDRVISTQFNLSVLLGKPVLDAPIDLEVERGASISVQLPKPADADEYSYRYELRLKDSQQALPDDLDFDAVQSRLTGSIDLVGVYTFVYTVTNSHDLSVSFEFDIKVHSATFSALSRDILTRQALIIAKQITSTVKSRSKLMGKALAPYERKGNREAINILLKADRSKGQSSDLALSFWTDITSTDAQSNLKFEKESLSWTGSTESLQFGFDIALSNALFGVITTDTSTDLALSGIGSYKLDLQIESPYVAYRHKDFEVWAAVGAGSGESDAIYYDLSYRSDVSYTMEHFGGRYKFQNGPTKLSVGYEETQASLEVEGSTTYGASSNEASSSIFSIDASRSLELGAGGTLTPSISFGLRTDRHDASDADGTLELDQAGEELGWSLSYDHQWLKASFGSSTYSIETPETSYEEKSSWYSLAVTKGNKLGFGYTFGSSQGAAQDYRSKLFGVRDLNSLEQPSSESGSMNFNQQLSYGWQLRQGVVSVFSKYTWSDDSFSLGNFEPRQNAWQGVGSSLSSNSGSYNFSMSFDPNAQKILFKGKIAIK